MAEEEETKPGANPISALQMAIDTTTRGWFRVDLDITSYSLKWENGWIMRVHTPQLKNHGVDSVCTYKKSEHSKGKKSHFSKAQNLTTCL